MFKIVYATFQSAWITRNSFERLIKFKRLKMYNIIKGEFVIFKQLLGPFKKYLNSNPLRQYLSTQFEITICEKKYPHKMQILAKFI